MWLNTWLLSLKTWLPLLSSAWHWTRNNFPPYILWKERSIGTSPFFVPFILFSQYWEIFLPGRGRDAICCVSTMRICKPRVMELFVPLETCTQYSPCPPHLREEKRRNMLRLYSARLRTHSKWFYSPVIVNVGRKIICYARNMCPLSSVPSAPPWEKHA